MDRNDPPVDADPITLSFECLKATQPIGDIFLAKIPYSDLIRITHFDVRRVLQEERDVERYLGIQRPLIPTKVAQLESYVNYYDASFPTAIIVAVEEQFTHYDETERKIYLSNVANDETSPTIPIRKIARVLDGQHRIAGLSGFSGDDFDLPVTIFVGADIADQAHVFATVNLEQQKVNKSLTYDLYSLAKSRSPQKTCHNVAVVLDKDPNSPFHKRIKRLGIATEGRYFEPISQATFVESLMTYISSNPKKDRDDILKGKALHSIEGEEIYKFPFRNMFIQDNDLKIVSVIFDYYSAIKERWPEAWQSREKGHILNRTNGFRAFMRAYGHIHKLHGTPSGIVPRHFFDAFLAEVKLDDKDFNTEVFPPGTTGESELLKLLRAIKM